MFSFFPFTSPYFARNRFDPLLQLYTLSNKQIVCVDDLHIHCQCQLYYNYTVSDDISMQRALNYHIVTYKSLNIHSLSLSLSLPHLPSPSLLPSPLFSISPLPLPPLLPTQDIDNGAIITPDSSPSAVSTSKSKF